MNKIVTLLLFIVPVFFINAQDSTKVVSPKIICKLKVGNTMDFDTKSIKFIEVLEDSRCPSDVTCMWAGQAKAIIGIYEKDMLLEERELIFGVQGIHPDAIKEIFVLDKKTVFGYNLSPYPVSDKTIAPSDYYLELLTK